MYFGFSFLSLKCVVDICGMKGHAQISIYHMKNMYI